MLNPKLYRDTPELVRQGLIKRNFSLSHLDQVIKLDEEWRKQANLIDELRNQLKSKTPKGKPEPEQLQALRELSNQIGVEEKKLPELEAELLSLQLVMPNLPDDSVPDGKESTENILVRSLGEIPKFSFTPKDHADLGEGLGQLDFKRATKIAQPRFALYFGQAAALERALINFMLDVHTSEHGYTEVIPPLLVNAKTMTGTGQLPKFAEELFRCKDDELYLIPTAEVPVTNIHADEILPNLPVAYTAYTPCFRREAGSYGKDTKGLIRQHQFNKVELVRFCKPEDSMAQLELLTSHAEKILQLLNLPYRVMALCTGDLGFSSSKTYDLEVWMPGQNGYREISSCSNFKDFQARRAMIRYKDEAGKNQYLHTINGSGLAIGRTFAAILENYQQEDGTVVVPEALRKYTGFDRLSR